MLCTNSFELLECIWWWQCSSVSSHSRRHHLLWRRAKVSVISKASIEEKHTDPECKERTVLLESISWQMILSSDRVAPRVFRTTTIEDDATKRRLITDDDDANNLEFIVMKRFFSFLTCICFLRDERESLGLILCMVLLLPTVVPIFLAL